MPTLVQFQNASGQPEVVSAANPLPVTGGGGGSGDVNLTEIAGNAVTTGNGSVTSGTLRITIADDSTGTLASIGSITNPVAVTQDTSPWVVSGTVTADQGDPNSVANAWPILVTDGTLSNSIRTLADTLLDTDNGMIVQSVIHGLTTGMGGGYVPVKVTPSGAMNVAATQDTSPWVVSATDLDIRDLVFATDSVDVSGSTVIVTATDLDIRALDFATDSIDVTGSDVTATVSGTVAVSSVGGTVAVTQSTSPWVVSGTVTANAGTDLNTSLLALESGGNLAAAAASLAIIDDWDESDRAKVNPIVGQAGVQGGSGTVSSSTQRVVLATDVGLPTGSNVIGAVTQSGTWTTARSWTLSSGTDSVTVTGTVAATQSGAWSTGRTWTLASGTDSIAAVQSGTWNIGTVTTVTAVTSITNPVSSKVPLTASSPTAATVGTSSGSAVASNANRKGLVLTNTSNNTISFGIGAAAVLNSGITLVPGGTWVMDEYTFSTGTINAIASAVSSNLAIQEFTT